MNKTVGTFEGETFGGCHPVRCGITDGRGGCISFTHKDIADLKHLLNQMEKSAKATLPERYKSEI